MSWLGQPSPAAVPCPGGCGAVVYCSAQCAQGAMDSQHSLLCAGLRRADDFAAKAAAQIEAEEEAVATTAARSVEVEVPPKAEPGGDDEGEHHRGHARHMPR